MDDVTKICISVKEIKLKVPSVNYYIKNVYENEWNLISRKQNKILCVLTKTAMTAMYEDIHWKICINNEQKINDEHTWRKKFKKKMMEMVQCF